MEPKDQILARMYVVLTLLSLVPLLVVLQTLRIHLAEGSELRQQGRRQASSFVSIPAVRGAIMDRAGRMLAVNMARFDLAVDPTVPGFKENESTFFERLSKLTGTSASSFRRRVAERSSPQYVLLLRAISEPQKESVESWQIPGLILEPTFARRYNYDRTAAHLLGYVSPDGYGIAGLELQYDERLRGRDGRRAVKRDRLGQIKAYVEAEVVEPVHGESLVLTIDLIRQTILEEELARGVEETGAKWGAAIALDPFTGAVIALANVPTFDPNRPAAFSDGARRNHAVTDRLEPGSTFKLVTAIAAIERDIVEMDDSVDTGDGWAVVQGRTLHDSHAYGRIPFREVIAMSSNVGTAKTALQIEPGVFYQYARNLGFGHPTWIDLPGEVGGLLKRPAEWSGTSLTSMSIGYEVDVTPIQLVTAYAALANGGLLVQPHLVSERTNVTGETVWEVRQDSVRRAFEARTSRDLRPAFELVVDDGTATRAQVEGLPIAGKTGTARKAADGSYVPGAYRATFVGYFPADDPKVVMAIVLDEPRSAHYGGSASAPIFQRTAKRWIPTFPEIARRVAPPAKLPRDPQYEVPDVMGLPAVVADRRLQVSGFRTRMRAEDPFLNVVAKQQPGAGSKLDPYAAVTLGVSDSTAEGIMPDLRGLSARHALLWLRSLKISARIEGAGMVVTQSPMPGRAVTGRAVLTCR